MSPEEGIRTASGYGFGGEVRGVLYAEGRGWLVEEVRPSLGVRLELCGEARIGSEEWGRGKGGAHCRGRARLEGGGGGRSRVGA